MVTFVFAGMDTTTKVNTLKRVLIVLADTGRGGAETQALNLCIGLTTRGFEVHVLSFGSTKGGYWKDFKKAGAILHLTEFNAKLLLQKCNSFKAIFIRFKYVLKFILQIRTIQADVILPFTYYPNSICARFWKYTSTTMCIWNQRDAGIGFAADTKTIKGLNGCSKIISNSLEGTLFLKKYTKKTISIIHNGVVFPDKHISYPEKDKIRLVMIANLHENKDHLTLLKAWEIIIRKKGSDVAELILAGREGNTSAEIYKFIQDHNLLNSVHCGAVTNVPELLLSCDIGVFSSLKEGLPNGILECMAVGLPIVATKMNGATECLGENYAFLSEPSNTEELAQMLLHFIDDVDLRKKIGCENRNRLESNFGMEKMVNQYIDLFNS